MTDTDRLAALLHDDFTLSGFWSCVHSPENEWAPWCDVLARRLIAAGVTLAPQPAADCGAYHPDHPGTRCRQPEGHSGEHATARRDVTWDNAYLSAPQPEPHYDANCWCGGQRSDHAAALAPQPDTANRVREALDALDALPVGHYRRNGFASPDPWVRQRDVRRIVARTRAALATEPQP